MSCGRESGFTDTGLLPGPRPGSTADGPAASLEHLAAEAICRASIVTILDPWAAAGGHKPQTGTEVRSFCSVPSNYSYPPCTLTDEETRTEMINRELQTSQREKQEILAFEGHLAAASTKQTITESSSLLLSQLTSLDPQYVEPTPWGQAGWGGGAGGVQLEEQTEGLPGLWGRPQVGHRPSPCPRMRPLFWGLCVHMAS